MKEVISGETSSKTVDETSKQNNNNLKPKASEQDLDAFLLGDLEDGDDGPGRLLNTPSKLVLLLLFALFHLEMTT